MRESSSAAGAMETSMFLIASGSSSLNFYGFRANFWFVKPYGALPQDDISIPWGGHCRGTSKLVSEQFVEELYHGDCIMSWGPIFLELYLTK